MGELTKPPGDEGKESGGGVARVVGSTVQWVFMPGKPAPSGGFEEISIEQWHDTSPQ